MALDTFICGSCQVTFNDMDQFVFHKKQCPATPVSLSQNLTQIDEAQSSGNVLGTTTDPNTEVVTFPEGSRVVTTEVVDSITGEQQTVIIIQPANFNDPNVIPQDAAILTPEQFQNLSAATQPPTKKKRGRPKKQLTENTSPAKVQKIAKAEKPPVPDIASDGKLHCQCCKKAFAKERFFKTHKCMPTTDYIDITKKSALSTDSDENIEPESEEEPENDTDQDFKVSNLDLKALEDEVDEEDVEEEDLEKPKKRKSFKVSIDPDGEDPGERPVDMIGDLPIFNSETEKAAFEQSLNVDLSFVDGMFRQHMIEQDLNDKAPVPMRMTTSTLNLYSCNECDKIFKTLSHMRLHCLIHTDAKPFKCPKCSYKSNGKGNLYTHMRKHTGQFYRCKSCNFKSVNKSHVLEHEAIHSNVRHQCELCKKDYNTLKSLINHIRKYHSKTTNGQEYLSTFLQGGRQRGTTVIHQCHVCNRKFKKKIDRDRHLYVHDITDIPTIQMCTLCDYTASRKVYLEKHFQKHRVIYRCVQCEEKFLSTIRLIDHLTSTHLKDDTSATKWESLFEECINNSLYLPEPDQNLSTVEKELVSLPSELSSTVLGDNISVAADSAEVCVSMESTSDDESKNLKVVQNDDTLPNCQGAIANDSQNSDSTGKKSADNEKDIKLESCENIPFDHEVSALEEVHIPTEGTNITLPTETSNINLPATDSDITTQKGPMEEETSESTVRGQSSKTIQDLIKSLGYRPLTLQIFHKMRETFGHDECEYCGKLYFNKMDFDQHVRTHTGDNPFPCTICGYRAKTRDALVRHKEKEHEKMAFPCKDCDFIANSRSQLWNHSLQHAGFSEDMGMECPECHQKISNLTKFKEHIMEAHPDCSNTELMKMHLTADLEATKHKSQGKIGRRSYKCPYCPKMFIRANSELQKHIWIHEGVKPYKCPLCIHACRSKNNLQAHMLRHSSEKPYTCSECNKAYKSKTALRWHVRSHKGKLFKCNKCPYEATQSTHLRRHMEIHNIIKKYACHYCDYTANTLSYLKIHHTRNHKDLPYKNVDVPVVEESSLNSDASQVYRCLSCDYLFGNLSDLKRHLKIRHHLTVSNFGGLDLNGKADQSESPNQVIKIHATNEINPDVPERSTPAVTAVAEDSEISPANLDEKTASAVNILQQIFGMSQQSMSAPQQFTIQSESGEVMTVNPETIIVQENGEQVLVTDSNQTGQQQYVIQYVNPTETQIDNSMVEIQSIQDVQHFQTIDQEIIQTIDQNVLTENVAEQQVIHS